jgi:hypothetical protein
MLDSLDLPAGQRGYPLTDFKSVCPFHDDVPSANVSVGIDGALRDKITLSV